MWLRSVHIKFKNPDDSIVQVEAHTGMSILDVAHQNDIELEGNQNMQFMKRSSRADQHGDVQEHVNPPWHAQLAMSFWKMIFTTRCSRPVKTKKICLTWHSD